MCRPTRAVALGADRFIHNWALRLRTDAYYDRHERMGYHEASAALTALKRRPETAWLNEVASVPLQQALRHIDKAFRHFFEGRAGYPAFHKKHGRQAATYAGTAFRWNAETSSLTSAKMDKPLDIRWSRSFTGTPTTVTISKDTAGRYFVSFLVEEEVAALPPWSTRWSGLDVGLKASRR